MNRKNIKPQSTIILISVVLSFLLLVSCKTGGGNPIPTGAKTRELPDGNIELVATGRASANAMEKNLIGMKRSTSCEAARLILKNELKKLEENVQNSFKKSGTFFLRNSEYCRIKGTYSPN